MWCASRYQATNSMQATNKVNRAISLLNLGSNQGGVPVSSYKQNKKRNIN